MPKVDIKEVEKRQMKVDENIQTIERREIGGSLYFRGKHLGEDDWFTDYGECHRANEDSYRQKSYKSQGLDELGRSTAQNSLAKKRQELIKKRDGFLDDARKVAIEIATLKESDFEKKPEKQKK